MIMSVLKPSTNLVKVNITRINSGTETFTEHYTTKSGDKIVAFGYYGYDG